MSDRVDLKVGFQCNNFCRFCVQGDKRQLLAAKPAAALRRLLEDGRREGANALVVTGGEPALHKDILEIVRAARALGYSLIQIQSNGRAFLLRGLLQAPHRRGRPNEFGPSLHGPGARIHDWLTGAPGAFVQTVAGIKTLKKLGQRVITNSVITKANYRELPDLARLLVALGVEQFQLAFMHLSGRAGENKSWLAARKSVIEPYVKAGSRRGDQGGPDRHDGGHSLLLHVRL